MLQCETCGQPLERRGTRGPVPRFCSVHCRQAPHAARKAAYDRVYYAQVLRPDRERMARRRAHDHEYNRRPEVREAYRLRWRRLFGDRHPEVQLPNPYHGHPWLERARAALGLTDLDPNSRFIEDYYDDMGEALLALMEGRDPEEAVRAYRRQEYVARHLTHHIDEWHDREIDPTDRLLPSAPSAEDEVMERLDRLEVKARYHAGENTYRHHTAGKSQPSQRRRKDAGWRKHAA